MSLKSIINQDIQTIEADLDNPYFTWQGEDYVCVPSTEEQILALENGGFSVNQTLVLTARVELFQVLPREQQKLTYNDREYRIISTKKETTGALIRLFCTDSSRGI